MAGQEATGSVSACASIYIPKGIRKLVRMCHPASGRVPRNARNRVTRRVTSLLDSPGPAPPTSQSRGAHPGRRRCSSAPRSALVTSEIVFLKEFCVGAALAVLSDATIVCALLVPALMALWGSANWWATAPLRRLTAGRARVV